MKKISVISDLHGKLPTIEPCDLLLIAGDICPHFGGPWGHVGDVDDVFGQSKWLGQEFSNWLDAIPAKEVVMTFGNHDWVAEKRPHLIPKLRAHVLMDSSVEVLGLKIWGSPFSPYFHGWAFNAPPDLVGESFLAAKWNEIPDDTDIIITHGPPGGYGDVAPDGRPTGSASLTQRVREIGPLLVASGHIHCGYGIRMYQRTDGEQDFGYIVNASVLDESYRLVRQPLQFGVDVEENLIWTL